MNADRDDRLEKIRHFKGTAEDFKSYLDDKIRETKEESNAFNESVSELNDSGVSIDNPDLLSRYGLKNVTLSRHGNIVTLTHFIADGQGRGNGTRFMKALTGVADEKGWILALTPDLTFGATSISRLKRFYGKFGFVDNKGRNTNFETRESMIRMPGKPNGSIKGVKTFSELVSKLK